jgi:hypothetical protein
MVTRKRFDPRSALPGSPFLTHVALREDRVQPGVHPFTVPWLLPSLDLQMSAPVTFLVGENGTGKSTLLEAIAWSVGFGAQGGNRDQSFAENADGHALAGACAVAAYTLSAQAAGPAGRGWARSRGSDLASAVRRGSAGVVKR